MDLVTALALKLSPQAPDVVSFVGGGGKTSALFRLASEITASNRRVAVTTTTRLSSHEITATQSVVEVSKQQLPIDDIARALDIHGQCMLVGVPGTPAEVSDLEGLKRTGLRPEQVDELVRYAGQLGLSAILIEADGSRMLPVKAPAQYEPVLPASTSVLIPVAGMDAVGRLVQEDAVHRPQNIRQLLGISSQRESIRLSPNMLAKIVVSEQGGAKHLPPGARLVPLFNKAERATRYAFARLACRHLTRMNMASLVGAVGAQHVPAVRERWGPLAAVVLAAGESRRMGHPKQILAVDGEPMVLRAARIALESGVSQVHVVTGAYAGVVT